MPCTAMSVAIEHVPGLATPVLKLPNARQLNELLEVLRVVVRRVVDEAVDKAAAAALASKAASATAAAASAVATTSAATSGARAQKAGKRADEWMRMAGHGNDDDDDDDGVGNMSSRRSATTAGIGVSGGGAVTPERVLDELAKSFASVECGELIKLLASDAPLPKFRASSEGGAILKTLTQLNALVRLMWQSDKLYGVVKLVYTCVRGVS
jgi:hypothetical protein